MARICPNIRNFLTSENFAFSEMLCSPQQSPHSIEEDERKKGVSNRKKKARRRERNAGRRVVSEQTV
jgi:hypothetical protein